MHPALALSGLQDAIVPSASVAGGMAGALIEEVSGRLFAPLVHPSLRVHAELDVLVLWAGEAGDVVSPYSGDLDNQLKTLFDGLRRPLVDNEVPKAWTPLDDEVPMHCLLDDDKLVTRINVEVDRLLRVPTSPHTHAEVQIRVTVRPYQATYANVSISG